MIQLLIRLIHRLLKKDKTPLIFVIGPTGVGKTKLSVELAKHFESEIISADSMQLYKDLDIITNKATDQEKQGVPHHLIDFADPLRPFTVVDYRNRALPIIEKLLKQNKTPVIAGGTMYYIESILYKILINPDDQGDDLVTEKDEKTMRGMIDSGDVTLDGTIDKETLFARPIIPKALKSVPSEVLHSILKMVDPEMANQLDPNEKRKIIRSLQVYQKSGRKHSEWIEEQKSMKGGNKFGGPLRYPNSLIFYLICDEEVLNKRLDDRVDSMIEQGLIDEMTKFHENYNMTRLEQKQTADYTEGIFQSIGFKEFHSYLMLSPEEKESEKGQKLLKNSVERLKLVTRRYARKQKKWIKNRLLKATDRPTPDIFELDTTNLDQWDTQVKNRAIEIVNLFSHYQSYPDEFKPIKQTIYV